MRENTQVSSTAQISELVKQALLENAPAEHIGAPIDVVVEESDDPSVAITTHSFESLSPSYPGWYWAVSIVELKGEAPTISEVNLLPGSAALVPPAWSPWADRIEAGDLGVGDLLPAAEDDPRLTAGFTGLDELADDLEPLHPQQWELGLGREQVLSADGLDRAVQRWFAGETGPRAAMAKSAPANCSSCGFLAPIGGTIGQAFGVCANALGAADGHIVAMTFGCGAHSSVRAENKAPVPVVELVVDDISDDIADASQLDDYVADVETGEIDSAPDSETPELDNNNDALVDQIESFDATSGVDLGEESEEDAS